MPAAGPCRGREGVQVLGPATGFGRRGTVESDPASSHHAAKEPEGSQSKATSTELMPPCQPQTGQRQKCREVEVELAGPSHSADVGEEDRQKIPAMNEARHNRVGAQAHADDSKEDAKRCRLSFSSLLLQLRQLGRPTFALAGEPVRRVRVERVG